MSLGEHLLHIADAGLAFAEDTKEQLTIRLTMLLDIENVLDKGRGYANSEERALVNEKLAVLRSKIREAIDSMPMEEARYFMIDRGRSAQNRFHLKGN